VEIARKGIFKERPHNLHPCEFARNAGYVVSITVAQAAVFGLLCLYMSCETVNRVSI